MEDDENDRKRKNIDGVIHPNNDFTDVGDHEENDVDCTLTLCFPFKRCTSSTLDPRQSDYNNLPPPPPPPPPPPSPPPSRPTTPTFPTLSSYPPPASYLYFMNNQSCLDQQQLSLFPMTPPPVMTPPAPSPPPPPPSSLLSSQQPYLVNNFILPSPSLNVGTQQLRTRRTPSQMHGKSDFIEPPYTWATEYRATVHNINYLLSLGIVEIEGEAQCRRCEARKVIKYVLLEKFREVTNFILARKQEMHTRAPQEWLNPVFPECGACGQSNCMRPVVADKKRQINWLFMLLGQSLGCCTLQQLKYFCKHSDNHRTGAKDRVLYLTYLGICKQLLPVNLFDP